MESELFKMQVAPTEQILRVESLSNYCKIYFVDKARPLVVSKVLKWVEGRLPEDAFLRIHRSHLVNKKYVVDMGGERYKYVLLMNGERINISRRKASQTMKAKLPVIIAD